MNTLQNVYNRLSDKTELAKHEVELATIDELKQDIVAYNKGFETYANTLKSLKSQLKELGAKYGKLSDLYNVWLTYYKDTEKKAKELGISLPTDFAKLQTIATQKIQEAKNESDDILKFM